MRIEANSEVWIELIRAVKDIALVIVERVWSQKSP